MKRPQGRVLSRANHTIQVTEGRVIPPGVLNLFIAVACIIIGVTTFCLIMEQFL